jgi:NTP pyrophosphatase (non-canonical NTP hydrolase)
MQTKNPIVERESEVFKASCELRIQQYSISVTGTPFRRDFGIRDVANNCHTLARSAGWWHECDGTTLKRVNVAEKLCLIHSEISEAMEGDRKDMMDDKLPDRKMLEVELADAVIRIFDLAGRLQLDIPGAMIEKLHFNQTRQDHKPESRFAPGGKKY